jgi:hypothetical protein
VKHEDREASERAVALKLHDRAIGAKVRAGEEWKAGRQDRLQETEPGANRTPSDRSIGAARPGATRAREIKTGELKTRELRTGEIRPREVEIETREIRRRETAVNETRP